MIKILTEGGARARARERESEMGLSEREEMGQDKIMQVPP